MEDRARPASLEDAVVEQVLEGEPRAAQWREWKQALERRRHLLTREIADAPEGSDTSELRAQLEETREQIQALSSEEAITQFVEDAARFSLLAAARPLEEDETAEEWE